MKNEENEISDEAETTPNIKNSLEEETAFDEFHSELNDSRWSVISFDKCEVSGLTYDEASRKLQELERNGIFGLCIVTNEAAEKIVYNEKKIKTKSQSK